MSRYRGFCSDHGYHDTRCQLCQAAQAYAMTQFDRHQKMAREALERVTGLGRREFEDLVDTVAATIRTAEASVSTEATQKKETAVKEAVRVAREETIEETVEAAEKKIREVMVGNYTHLINSYVSQITEAIRKVGRKPVPRAENHAHA
jgi:hypothetical protein